MDAETNPYRSPQTYSENDASLSQIGLPGVVAQCVNRGWISRSVKLSGVIEAVIRYNGGAVGERVYVDGVLAARPPFFTSSVAMVAPHVDFTLLAHDREIPAAIDVKVGLLNLLRISRFSLTVDGAVVYSE